MPNTKPTQQANEAKSRKILRVDFLGSALFAAVLILFLLPLELGGSKVAWNDPQIPIYFGLSALMLAIFIAVEKRWASNPLLPLSMFHNRHTVAAFVIMALQCAAQLGVILKFSSTRSFQACAHIFIDDVHSSAVLSSYSENEQHCCCKWLSFLENLSDMNALAKCAPPGRSIAPGRYWKCNRRHRGRIHYSKVRPISRPHKILDLVMFTHSSSSTGKYKWLMFLAALLSASSYTLLILRWHGSTGWLETLYIFPG